MVAARCANPAPTGCAIRGFGRTLEVFRTGEPGPVMRPVWCRGERKTLSGASRQLPQRGSQENRRCAPAPPKGEPRQTETTGKAGERDGGENVTFLERLEKEHPDFIGSRYPGGVALCPEDCGYEKRSPCEAMAGGSFDPSACLRCWGREAEDTSSAAAAAPSPQGEGKGRADEDGGDSSPCRGAMKGGGDGGGQDHREDALPDV